MTQKNCLYIVASSFAPQAHTILSEKLSLLFGNFETITVGPFDLHASLGLVDRHLDRLKIGLSLKNFIGDFTGGYPLYINVLCQEIVALSGVHRQEEVYAPIVTQALENLLFNPWGVLSRHFELKRHELCRGRSSDQVASVLIALAQGKHRIGDIAAHARMKPTQATARINQLMDADIVERNGNYFHLKDKLFKYWIKYVLERRLFAVELEQGRARRSFKEEINRSVNEFQMVSRKDLATRIVDLAHKFDNESFELAGRRYRLSQFADIVPIKLRLGAGNFVDAIHARGDEGVWLMVLKKDPMLEQDLHALLLELKRMEPRPVRTVVVSLRGLDHDARVRALQEKLWVWNEPEINALMHLFDEPYISA